MSLQTELAHWTAVAGCSGLKGQLPWFQRSSFTCPLALHVCEIGKHFGAPG